MKKLESPRIYSLNKNLKSELNFDSTNEVYNLNAYSFKLFVFILNNFNLSNFSRSDLKQSNLTVSRINSSILELIETGYIKICLDNSISSKDNEINLTHEVKDNTIPICTEARSAHDNETPQLVVNEINTHNTMKDRELFDDPDEGYVLDDDDDNEGDIADMVIKSKSQSEMMEKEKQEGIVKIKSELEKYYEQYPQFRPDKKLLTVLE